MSSHDGARDQLVRGVASAKAGEIELARRYFERALHLGPDLRGQVDAYYWLARLSESGEEKRDFLTRVLQLEPTHYAARRDLAVLDGELQRDELIDPNEPQLPARAEPEAIAGERYVCPRCGGRLTSPAGSRELTCSFCGYSRDPGAAAAQGSAVAESDFIHALVTARGHSHPRHTPTFTCEACGASYMLAPGTLSLTCPHCGSVYAVKRLQSQNLVPAQGLIPFEVGEGEAGLLLRRWLDREGLHKVEGFAPLYGVYLPAWTFDLSGEAGYTYLVRKGDRWVSERGSHPLLENDLAVPASHRLPKSLAEQVRGFDLEQLEAFDPSLLAGWPAQAYEIPAADAAMAARWQAIDKTRGRIERGLPARSRELQLRSPDLLVSAYRLILLPFWLTNYRYQGRRYQAIVNGQTGTVHAEMPPRGWWQALKSLLIPT